ncbi:unnamed protein product [Meganyctiphanes norvegica]|uniref:Uncharacterized protein n=1 Tax=Meganyctiphanes norvegica TaxID=48144 RepID=A0AAV2RBB7_MEGNR
MAQPVFSLIFRKFRIFFTFCEFAKKKVYYTYRTPLTQIFMVLSVKLNSQSSRHINLSENSRVWSKARGFLSFRLLLKFFFSLHSEFNFGVEVVVHFKNICVIFTLFGDIWQLTFQKHDFEPLEADFRILPENELKIQKLMEP